MLQLLMSVPAMLSSLFGWLGKLSDNKVVTHQADVSADTTVNVEAIRSRATLGTAALAARTADGQHWYTAWMVPTAFGVFMLHVAAIVFDSIPLFGHVVGSWQVKALPPIYADMETNVILTVCGVATGAAVIGKLFSR